MSLERDCTTKIRKLVGTPAYDTFVAKVTKVDGATCTVERIIDGKKIDSVRLNVSSTEKQGIVITPKINSNVLITTIDGYQWFVSQYSEIDKITVDAENTIVFNGGENDGLVKVKAITDRINDIENRINDILTALLSTTITLAPTGEYPLTPHFSSIYPLSLTQQSQIENNKITH